MASTPLRKVLVIVGTTGAGKTKLSIDLAKAVGGEIINSDAMQMYRGLDIATAKITEQEKEGIPHHLFDVIEPSSRCDVLEFKQLALTTIEDVLARGKVPIIVGGTMYYTHSILWKAQLLDDVPVVKNADDALGNLKTPQDLFSKLWEVDPVMASRLHVNNVRKVQRSLQVFYQIGIPHSELLKRQEEEKRNQEKYFDVCSFWVHCNKDVLANRLAKRVEKMLSTGLVDEIKSLAAQVKANPPRLHPDRENDGSDSSVGILQAIGYKEFQPYLDALETVGVTCGNDNTNETEEESEQYRSDLDRIFQECVDQLNVATRQYARRQLSWIRNKFATNNIPVYQVDSSDITKWESVVAAPAIQIASDFLANRPITTLKSIQEQHPEAQPLSLQDKYEENVCTICGDRKFTGKAQWEAHLKSKGHKFHVKRVEMEKNGTLHAKYRSLDSQEQQSEQVLSKRAKLDDSRTKGIELHKDEEKVSITAK